MEDLPHFFFFVDEFQNFANESFADILAEARKYKLNLTVAHQYVDQMQEDVAAAIFGNVGTMITFRIGATDAEVFEKQFSPTFTAEDIVNLGKYQIYLSLMIDGIGSRPFSATTIAPIPLPDDSMRSHVIANSRYYYAKERCDVEEKIEEWYKPIKKPVKKRINDPKDLLKKSKKKSFIVKEPNFKEDKSRDFASPIKKVLKEVDEKEAELEMKKIISPRLNSLLDNFDKNQDGGKKIGEVIKNIKQKDSFTKTSKQDVSDSVKQKISKLFTREEPKKNKRGAQSETKSSLADILSKALDKKSKIEKYPSKTIKKDNNSRKKEVPEDVLRDVLK